MRNTKAHILGIALYGIACAGAGAFLYSCVQNTAARATHSILYRNNLPAEYSFADPYGLIVDRRLSPEGKIETYIQHEPSKREYLISRDMFPDTDTTIVNLKKRIYTMQKPEQKQALDSLTDIVEKLGKL